VSCIDSSLKALNFSGEGPKSSAELYFLWEHFYFWKLTKLFQKILFFILKII
jgi:hypothetical protein